MWDWIRDNPWAAWSVLGLGLAFAELLSLDLVLLMLAVGAFAGALTGAFTDAFVVQALVAAVTSVAMLAAVRPNIVRRLHSGPTLKHGAAALVGTTGFAVAEITSQAGLVKLAGETWTARPYEEDTVIPQGCKVEVFEIRGATAYVHQVPELGA